MENRQAVIELHYFPSIAYMATFVQFPQIYLESKESFIKQTYRNRCRILSANKIENLIVPVEKAGNNIPIQEIRISYHQNWTNDHWRTIQTAYGNAPYFEYYSESLKKILFKKNRFLFDLNLSILDYMLDELDIQSNYLYTEKFFKEYPNDISDLRSAIHPKKKLDLLGFYSPVEYIQVFGEKFVPDLSTIDLIFNEGPNAKRLINRSIGNIENN